MPVQESATPRFTTVAITLHWVLAVALVAVFGFGLYMADLPFSPQRLKLFNWHKWAGVSILFFSAVRLAWRITHRPPELPATVLRTMKPWQTMVLGATHIAMYALFFLVPLIGWAYSSADGFSIVLFGVLPLPDFISPDKALAHLIKPWHRFSAYALAGLVVLHVAAALKHQFLDRDGLMNRMLPGGT